MPTYPLLCLAAQFSERVYTRPTGAERETHVDANWRHGTKAMVLKSIPIDDMNTVVFAIRGSQTFMDWAVNFRPAPSSPERFLVRNSPSSSNYLLTISGRPWKSLPYWLPTRCATDDCSGSIPSSNSASGKSIQIELLFANHRSLRRRRRRRITLRPHDVHYSAK